MSEKSRTTRWTARRIGSGRDEERGVWSWSEPSEQIELTLRQNISSLPLRSQCARCCACLSCVHLNTFALLVSARARVVSAFSDWRFWPVSLLVCSSRLTSLLRTAEKAARLQVVWVGTFFVSCLVFWGFFFFLSFLVFLFLFFVCHSNAFSYFAGGRKLFVQNFRITHVCETCHYTQKWAQRWG